MNILMNNTTFTLASVWDNLWWRGFKGESNFADGTDAVFFFIFWVSVFFFVLLMGLMVFFAVKYRRKPGVPIEHSPSHNTPLELSWSIIPAILMGIMFFWGLDEYLYSRVSPVDAEEINVTAQQWGWGWEYEGANGTLRSTESTLLADAEAPVFALPAGKPVKFIMSSQDVIHSMYIAPFRIKKDVFPNRYTTMWVEPQAATHKYEGEGDDQQLVKIDEDKEEIYLACTEYCGDQHSQMWALIKVLDGPDYRKWKEKQSDTSGIPLVDLGAIIRIQQGCNACHTVDGSDGTGPSWKGVWGQTRNFAKGDSAVMDMNYVRESIIEPEKHIVEGYPNQMVSYAGRLTDREIRAIAVYIRSLSSDPADQEAAQRISEQELEEREAAKEEASSEGGS